MAEDKTDLIILVHGTFAKSPDDIGNRWWQSNSDFCTKLNHRLRGKAECVGPGEVFHWTGANLETDRRLASHALATRFRKLEEQGRPYHVIAHSHGGNVVLNALFRCDGELKHLRSWATVGTPFFRFKKRLVNLLPLVPMSLMAIGFFMSTGHIPGWFISLERVSAVVLLTTCLIGVAIFLLAAVLMFSLIDRGGPYGEMRIDEYLRKKAQSKWTCRWLSIWSEADEAMSALTSIASFNSAFIPRAKPHSRGNYMKTQFGVGRRRLSLFEHSQLWPALILGRPATRILELFTIPFRNWIIIPLLERRVTKTIRKLALGDDSLDCENLSIRCDPFDHETEIPRMPARLTELLVTKANQELRNSTLLPAARTLLANAAFGGGSDLATSINPQAISNRVLVHTSYFELDDIVEMLALHIESSRGEMSTSANPELKDWIEDFYLHTNQHRG